MDLTAWNEAQRSLIGALLLDPDRVAGEIFQRARPADFGEPSLRHVYEAARDLWNENRPIDPVTLQARCGDDYNKLLADCMRMTPTAENAPAWLDVCRDAAQLSAMQGKALAIINAKTSGEAAEAYDQIGQLLGDLEDVEDLSVTDLIGGYLDRMHDRKPPDYLSWGIAQLDEVLNAAPGQFGVIAADSSVGKTALALQFAYHMAQTGRRVGFFSLETPMENLQDRLMAEKQVAAIPLPATKKKSLTAEDFRRAGEAGMKSDGLSLRIIRKADSLDRIRAVTLRRRLDVIFIDYVQLIDAPGRERWDIVTNISLGLHRMAQQLGITVVGLSQITPAAKGSKTAPTKDDLRESRQLKQDADFILILSPSSDDEDPANTRILDIAKNKDGPCKSLKLSFEPQYMTFTYQPPSVDAMRHQGRAKKNSRAPARADTQEPGALQELPGGEEDLPF